MSARDHVAKLESLLETVRRNAQKPRGPSVAQPQAASGPETARVDRADAARSMATSAPLAAASLVADAAPTPPPAAVREPAPAAVTVPVTPPAPVAASLPVAAAVPPPVPPVAAAVPPAAPPIAAAVPPPIPPVAATAPVPAEVPIDVTVESPAPAEIEELDMTETEIVEVSPGSTDEIPEITVPDLLEPVPESAPRPAVQTIEREIEREIEPPVKTPPPESGRQALTPVPGTPYANLAEGSAKTSPEPLIVTRPQSPEVVAAEIVASKPARMPETFLELLDASLRLG